MDDYNAEQYFDGVAFGLDGEYWIGCLGLFCTGRFPHSCMK